MTNESLNTVSMKLHFEVHASLVQQLGEQLITDDIAAVAELVKNSYDADASLVEINVDPNWIFNDEHGNAIYGKIEISDNGFGMSLESIKDGWLTISRSDKRIMKENGTVTERFKRLPLGDKGLGRLSAQRLGKYLQLTSKRKKSTEEIRVIINWEDFKKDQTLSNISIPLTTRKLPQDQNDKSYTTLIITGLNDCEKWLHQESINQFEASLSRITSPFDFNKSFFIKAKVGARQLELPQVSKELLNLAPVSYSFQVDKQAILIKGRYRSEYFPDSFTFGDRLKEFAQIIKQDLPRNNTIYLEDGPIVFEYEERINLVSLGDYTLDCHPGNFQGYIYDYPLDRDTFNILSNEASFKKFEKLSDFRTLIKAYKGVKIFRDQFRILPYGEDGAGSDWMKLGESFTGGSSFYFLRPANVVGYINLSGTENKNLKEKTDREGFVENQYSKTFFSLCQHIIRRINLNREFLRRRYNDYRKNLEDKQEARSKQLPSYIKAKEDVKQVTEFAEKIAQKTQESRNTVNNIKQVVDNSKKKINSFNLGNSEKEQINSLLKNIENSSSALEKLWKEISDNADKIHNARAGAVTLVSQIELMMNQVQEVIELAGLGLTAETLTHELFTLVDNTRTDVNDLRKYLKGNFDNDKKTDQYLDSILARADALRKQITHLSPGFKNVRTKNQRLNIKSILAEHANYYYERAKRKGIEICILNNNNFQIFANKGMIMQVFDNLYLNAEFWLDHAAKNNFVKEKKYFIEVFNPGIVQIWDSGLGIDKNMDDRIFDPFISSKPEGRGLGLYIVSRILGYYECSIRLMEPKNSFGNRYKFSLNFSPMIVEE